MVQNVNFLDIFNNYTCLESTYVDNSIHVKIDELTFYDFFIDISFSDHKVEEDFENVCDDYDVDDVLEIINEKEIYKKSIEINGVRVKIQTHDNLYDYVVHFQKVIYSLYEYIPSFYYSSDDDSGFCPYYSMFYTFDMQFDLFNKNFLDELMSINKAEGKYSTVKEEKKDFTTKYYESISWYGWQDFSEHLTVRHNEINIISAQTKVRRLAYIKMILRMFDKSSYYPDNVFNKKVELEASSHENDLLLYANNKGKIDITKTGNSSKPYVEIAMAMQLLYFQNNAYKISKFGKILLVLDNKLSGSTNNYFELSKFQKAFFLFFILQNDGFYLWILLELINLQGNKTTLKDLKKEFQAYALSQLKFVLKNSDISTPSKNEVSAKIKRMKDWKKPESYLEHIVDPRINWLFDLNIIDSSDYAKNLIALSPQGKTLLNSLSSYTDIFLEKYTILEQLRCMDYFDLINDMYDVKAERVDEVDIELIDQYISESFFLFKTMAPNRVTASQAMLYTCFMILFKEKKIINFCTIDQYLNSKKNTQFIFDWYKTEQDGSIRRKK